MRTVPSHVGRYSIHRIAAADLPPVSRSAARRLAHPHGSFAAYHPDPLLVPGFAPLPHWDTAAHLAETAVRDFEQRHGGSASRVAWVLQRSESVGSSTIEDVSPSLRRVARAEAVTQNGGDPHDDAATKPSATSLQPASLPRSEMRIVR